MPGVRIRPREDFLPPESAYGRLVVVRDVTRPLTPPPFPYKFPTCGVCGVPHEHKTYHLQLDGDGTVMVSETIWGRLGRLHHCGGFELANEVKDPPAQGIVLPTATVNIRPAEM